MPSRMRSSPNRISSRKKSSPSFSSVIAGDAANKSGEPVRVEQLRQDRHVGVRGRRVGRGEAHGHRHRHVAAHVAVDHEQRRHLLLAGERHPVERPGARLGPPDDVRRQRRGGHRRGRDPRVPDQDVGERPRPAGQPFAPRPGRHDREVRRTVGRVEHHLEQLLLGVDVPVQRHRRHPELGRHRLHRHAVQPVPVGHHHSGGAELLDGPPGLRPAPAGGLAVPEQLEVPRERRVDVGHARSIRKLLARYTSSAVSSAYANNS